MSRKVRFEIVYVPVNEQVPGLKKTASKKLAALKKLIKKALPWGKAGCN